MAYRDYEERLPTRPSLRNLTALLDAQAPLLPDGYAQSLLDLSAAYCSGSLRELADFAAAQVCRLYPNL